MATNLIYDTAPEPEVDYNLSSIEGSRVQVRGPLPELEAPFVAVLGGTEAFGKYIEAPFPTLIADWSGVPVANLGVAHAGVTLLSEDPQLLKIASKAQVTVLQVLGAQNMSNRLYTVHSRRNDRFVKASPALRTIFPDVDFAEINFTGHLLNALRASSEMTFELVVDELKCGWVHRMRRILSMIENDVVLLWISDHAPTDTQNTIDECDPHFVDAAMIDEIKDDLAAVVEVSLSTAQALDGKVFPAQEREAASRAIGPSDHQRIAESLAPVVARWIDVSGGKTDAARQMSQSFSTNSGTAVKRSATNP